MLQIGCIFNSISGMRPQKSRGKYGKENELSSQIQTQENIYGGT